MSDLLRGNLKLLVLNLLSQHPVHGYGLFKELETVYNWKPSCGTLYPVLSILENEGMIKSSETVECGRFKKIYAITPKGREGLKEMIKNFQESLQLLRLNERF
ncbi:MAG: PadR family transcriptional regulator [Nanoarchaeota archaeon]|nr:PadR family transcriptional regulator [Nanoarchaeota archaeon]